MSTVGSSIDCTRFYRIRCSAALACCAMSTIHHGFSSLAFPFYISCNWTALCKHSFSSTRLGCLFHCRRYWHSGRSRCACRTCSFWRACTRSCSVGRVRSSSPIGLIRHVKRLIWKNCRSQTLLMFTLYIILLSNVFGFGFWSVESPDKNNILKVTEKYEDIALHRFQIPSIAWATNQSHNFLVLGRRYGDIGLFDRGEFLIWKTPTRFAQQCICCCSQLLCASRTMLRSHTMQCFAYQNRFEKLVIAFTRLTLVAVQNEPAIKVLSASIAIHDLDIDSGI